MVITIDGPAGAGKSTISKKFAKTINYEVLDTGAMYRCVALLYNRLDTSIDSLIFQSAVKEMTIEFKNQQVFLNKEDVSSLIRTPEIDILTSSVISVEPFIRQHLKVLQRQIAQSQNIVAEGRDMGTNVFTDAFLKFYLTASVIVRAERRYKELLEKNIKKDIEVLKQEIEQRDHKDSNRSLNPLYIPKNAFLIDTGDDSIDEIIDKMVTIYKKHI